MNILNSLTETQLDQLYDWLLDMPTQQVVEKLAQPVPEGFGVKTHVTTLRRFEDRRWAELAADRIEASTQLTGTSAVQHEKLDTGILTALKHHMFQRVSSPDVTDDQLSMVSRWAHRQEKLKLDIQRVQIARERCAQNDRRLQLLARSKNFSFSGGTRRAQSAETLNRTGVESPILFSHDAITPNIATPTGQENQDARTNPNNPDHPVNPVENPSAISASSENLELKTQNSELGPESRPCDHLGPLARNWEDVRERAQKAFGITPEESARRAELRRRLCPHLYNNGGTRSPSPILFSRDAITPNSATPADQETQDTATNPNNPAPLPSENHSPASTSQSEMSDIDPLGSQPQSEIRNQTSEMSVPSSSFPPLPPVHGPSSADAGNRLASTDTPC